MNTRTFVDQTFWVEKEGELLRVGLTQEALSSFSGIDWIEMPVVGSILQKGETALTIESSKAAIDIESPFSGTVKDVNSLLLSSPKLLEEAPEKTWLLLVEECSDS